jgi:hypothetical protein
MQLCDVQGPQLKNSLLESVQLKCSRIGIQSLAASVSYLWFGIESRMRTASIPVDGQPPKLEKYDIGPFSFNLRLDNEYIHLICKDTAILLGGRHGIRVFVWVLDEPQARRCRYHGPLAECVCEETGSSRPSYLVFAPNIVFTGA